MKKISLSLILFFAANMFLFAQNTDKSKFTETKPGFYQNVVLKDVKAVEENLSPEKTELQFEMDQTGLNLPNKINLYKSIWAQPTLSQGNAGTCWSFSTTSFFESEVFRISKKKVKISEIYTAYWEYVEKAKRFIKERGNSVFSEGSEANAVQRIFKTYGAVPQESYTGLLNGRKYHSHEKMYNEMNSYLNGLKTSNSWNEDEAINTIKSIMNHYIGVPPTKFTVEGKEYTPTTYLNDYLQIKPDDYVDIMSFKQSPYWTKAEYTVEDNWWHSVDYLNVPLDDFMSAIKTAIKNGYSIAIGGDVSEAGFSRVTQCAIIPTWDIPSQFINEDARQFRFSNNTTTDDHGMHVIGWVEKDGKTWFLIKDSSSGSRNNDSASPEFGYYFFSEDFVKLKMTTFLVHKDAVPEIMKKFVK
ncbi:MAG: C1 family peptidase [Bacteroidota bacterium]